MVFNFRDDKDQLCLISPHYKTTDLSCITFEKCYIVNNGIVELFSCDSNERSHVFVKKI